MLQVTPPVGDEAEDLPWFYGAAGCEVPAEHQMLPVAAVLQ